MARVTVEEVRVILPVGSALTDSQIQAAIDAATLIVDQLATDGCLISPSDALLKQIELYLAAHTAAVMENTLSISSEKDPTCGSSITYGFKFGEGVKGTPFGQMANTLSSGCLAEYDKQPINFYSIGTHGE